MQRSALTIILVVSGLYPAFAYSDEPAPSWVKVTDKAAWQPRDSSGEVVYKDQLWLLGGWFDSFAAPPRDVWSSSDGKSWKLVEPTAPWKHSDLPMTLVFGDKMWIMGGWYNGRLAGHSASSEVWSSTDGVKWEQATASAGWTPRLAAGAAVFKGRMWILGGIENYYFGDEARLRKEVDPSIDGKIKKFEAVDVGESLKNDVWSSVDGKTWKLETPNAGWAPRAYHAAVALNDRLYVFGGGNYVPKYQIESDVWSSADGVHWEKVLDKTSWSPRLWFSSVVYRDRMWVLGGWSNNPARNWGDVWYSKDGKAWKELKSPVVWKERHEHSAYVFQDKIWVAGGHAMPLSNEVWSLEVPKEWFKD